MSYPTQLDIARDGARRWTSFVKYGHASNVGQSFVPVTTQGGVQLPTPAEARPLRVVSNSTADTVGGAGGHTVLLRGLDASGEEVNEVLTLDGTTPSAFTSAAFWRLNFVDLLTSGTYASATTGSHIGDITVEDGAANVWALLDSNDYPHSRWQSSWYTVPARKSVLISQFAFTANNNSLVDFKGLARTGATIEAASYSAMAELFEVTGLGNAFVVPLDAPVGPFPPLTDIGFLGRVNNNQGDLSVAISFLERTS